MPLRRGTICLVTDGARLAPGATIGERRAALVAQARAAGQAGFDFIQIRERDLAARDLLALAIDMIAAAGEHTHVLVNDRLDVAIAAGAAGVHLGGRSIGAPDARAIAHAPFVISRAAHSIDEVRRARSEGATDFVVFGTVFRTASKPADHVVAGIPLLAEASRCGIPVLAIGGVDALTVREVAATPVAGVAAIGWFLTTDARQLSEAAAVVHRTFDTTERLI